MLRQASSRSLCTACSGRLLDLFVNGFAASPVKRIPNPRPLVANSAWERRFHQGRIWRSPGDSIERDSDGTSEDPISSENQTEIKAREARQLFGDRLPLDYLSVDEYRVYERLYGPPLSFIAPEDEATAQIGELDTQTQSILTNKVEPNVLYKDVEDGLEEVEYIQEQESMVDDETVEMLADEADGAFEQHTAEDISTQASQDGFMVDDLELARSLAQQQKEQEMNRPVGSSQEDSETLEEGFRYDGEDSDDGYMRSHPLTSAGRFSTAPRAVIMPAAEMIEPVQSHLADNAKYAHLIEGAEKIFGGRRLPDSNATPPMNGRQIQQKPLSLSASQPRMSKLDANLFLSTVMPGTYATSMSILVEVRKRLGSSWLEGLLKKRGGPRILDAGGGGAGVMAWRNVLSAEWNRMHEDSGRIAQSEPNLGKSTVLAGSRELQSAVSQLLDNTSFIPRLPDFDRLAHMASSEDGTQSLRKQYDLIIAPYSIWPIEEDYMKKALVQNLWSLLDPNGGVLILSEKGLPRGFEAIAGAREVLLNHHIKTPRVGSANNMEAVGHKHTQMEDGMIIAPCTNHNTCPMYKIPGDMTGRKDFCSFEQRFVRPPYLQRILGAKFHNHEDIRFSYIAVQRGKDSRKELGFKQDEEATEKAFAGYEEAETDPPTLSLPRIINPPLKRTGHVIFDVCTPSGTFERWTTPKSFSKLAYRDGRKARWGDLWALGAKTRLAQPVRTGRPKAEKPDTRRAVEAALKLGGDASMLDNAFDENSKPKKVKRGDKGWKVRIGRKPKYGNNPSTRKADKVAEEML